MKGLHQIALIATFLAASGSASATLIEVDLLTSGDGLVTRDTLTGLDWLDVTASQGLSFNDVLGGAGGWAALGFRHATATEVCALFGTYAGAPTPCPGGPFGSLSDPGDAATFVSLFGETSSGWTRGVYDDFPVGVTTDVGTAVIETSGFVNIDFDFGGHTPDSAFGTFGNYLVRPVPEPSTALLLGLGLAYLTGRRKNVIGR